MRVLLVEDDDRVSAALRDVLRRHGFTVLRARSGGDALAMLDDEVDVVVLDLGLPDRDGFDVCARIRERGDTPVIMATARGELTARVHGLHLGADDYLVKPFDVRELMARIHAVTRRRRPAPSSGQLPQAGSLDGAPAAPQPPLQVGRITIDLARREVAVAGEPVALTRKEFELLALLCGSPGVVFRRDHIISQVWESRWGGGQRTLEVHIASLRAKLGDPAVIETVRGVGYRIGGG